MANQLPSIAPAAPWALDSDGWCVEAETYENQQKIAATPMLYEIAKAMAGTEGVWADNWLNQLARDCTAALKVADQPQPE